METPELIRMQTLLSYRVDLEGRLSAFPGYDPGDVPRFTVDRFAGGYLRHFREGLPDAARERLANLPSGSAFDSPGSVFRVLGRRRLRSVEVLYHVTDPPALEAAAGASRQGDHFVVLSATGPLAWAWTVREHSRAEQGSVETVAAFRRQGHGRAALAAWLRHVLARGKVPFLSHPEGNEAAERLLRSLGAIELSTRVSYA